MRPVFGDDGKEGMHRISGMPLYALVIAFPFGVAMQNLVAFGVVVWLSIHVLRRYRSGIWRGLGRCSTSFILNGLLVLTLVTSTVIHHAETWGWGGRVLGGYGMWMLVPPLLFLYFSSTPVAKFERGLTNVLTAVCLLWGLIALSQALWGWKVAGAALVDGPTRAQGFYSHPLTFAYASLILLPFGVFSLSKSPWSVRSWILLLGPAVALVCSESRAAAAVAVVVVVAELWRKMKGRGRWIAMGAVAAVVAITMTTDNRIGNKMRATLSGGFDARSGYYDDRLAYWHVAWEMIKDRPVLGHGMGLGRADREPYYHKLDLSTFERQYEAHNTFLQMGVNGGGLALVLFLAIMAWYLRWAWQCYRSSEPKNEYAWVAFLTLACLLAASLAQNAFQDAEVRYGLTLVCAAILALAPRDNEA